MMKELNKPIATKGFATLVLDYDFPAVDGFPPCVSCRILIEDVFQCRIHTETITEAIQVFTSGAWHELRQ